MKSSRRDVSPIQVDLRVVSSISYLFAGMYTASQKETGLTLDQWFSACGSRPHLQGSHIRCFVYQIFTLQFITVASDSYEIAMKSFYVGGVTQHEGLLLKGQSIRSAESHWSTPRRRRGECRAEVNPPCCGS